MEAIYLIFVLVMVLFVSALLGGTILAVSKINIPEKHQTISAILLGLFALVFIDACVLTGGKTVLWGIPIIVLFAGFLFKDSSVSSTFNKSFFKAWDLPNIGYLLIPLLFWFFFYNYQFYSYAFVDGEVCGFHPDMMFYVKLSEIIKQTGIENMLGSINLMQEGDLGNMPYHYFEIYLNQLISALFGLNGVKCIVLVVFPLCLTLLSYLVFHMLLSFLPSANTFLLVFAAILMLFMCGIELPLSRPEVGNYSINLSNEAVPKYTFPFILFLLSLWMIFKNQSLKFVLFLWLIPVISYAFLVVITVATFGAIFSQLIFIKTSRNKETYILAGLSILMAAYHYLFYKVIPVDPSMDILGVDLKEAFFNLLGDLVGFVKLFIGSHVYYWLDYVVYLIFFGLLLLSERKKLTIKISFWTLFDLRILVPLFMFWGGLISWGVFRTVSHEAFQTFYMTVGLFSNALLIVLTIIFYQNFKTKRIIISIFISVVAFIGIVETISDNYIFDKERFGGMTCTASFYDNLISKLANDKEYNNRIAFILKKPIKTEIYPLGGFIYYWNSSTSLISINLELIKDPISTNVITPFYQYYLENKKSPIDQIQYDFLKEYNIRYLLVRSDQLIPQEILKKSDLILRDSSNNYSFYKIN